MSATDKNFTHMSEVISKAHTPYNEKDRAYGFFTKIISPMRQLYTCRRRHDLGANVVLLEEWLHVVGSEADAAGRGGTARSSIAASMQEDMMINDNMEPSANSNFLINLYATDGLDASADVQRPMQPSPPPPATPQQHKQSLVQTLRSQMQQRHQTQNAPPQPKPQSGSSGNWLLRSVGSFFSSKQ